MNRIIDLFYNIKHFMYRYFIIKYHNVPFYRALFWRLLWQHITRGYDESITWDLSYYVSKWLYPRLLMFYDKIDEIGAIPASYESKMISIYIENGFEYDKLHCRFKDKEVQKEMHKDALNMWKEDVWMMCEAFRDILEEDDRWESWKINWNYYVKSAQKTYDSISNKSSQKKYWDDFGFKREWFPGIRFNECDFSERYRRCGLNLFAEHFQSLWW